MACPRQAWLDTTGRSLARYLRQGAGTASLNFEFRVYSKGLIFPGLGCLQFSRLGLVRRPRAFGVYVQWFLAGQNSHALLTDPPNSE